METRSPITSDDRNVRARAWWRPRSRWRTDPPSDEASVVELLRAELVPLYLEYVEDHVPRLEAMGRDDLAAAFEEWRRQLLA